MLSDAAVLRAANGPVYNSPNPAARRAIENLATLDLLDEQGREIRVYDANGKYIPRRVPARRFTEDEPVLGMLQDLTKVRNLFDRPFDEDDNDEDDIRMQDDEDEDEDADHLAFLAHTRRHLRGKLRVNVRCYPHFYSRNIGQWQADDVPAALYPTLRNIDSTVRRPNTIGSAIEGDSAQMYGALMHNIRDTNRSHIPQLGMLTACAGGAWAHSAKNHTTADRLFNHVSTALPHQRLAQQINGVGPSFLRFECDITLHLIRFNQADRNGTAIYNKVIQPWIAACSGSDVANAIRSSTILFKPGVRTFAFLFPLPVMLTCIHPLTFSQVYPQIYLWASYPITVLLNSIWNHCISPVLAAQKKAVEKARAQQNGNAFDPLSIVPGPHLVELIALAERALNFCHTGAAACLTNTAGGPLWITRALLDGFLPMFSPALSYGMVSGELVPSFSLSKWPLHPRTLLPADPAKRALELTYGTALATVSCAHMLLLSLSLALSLSIHPSIHPSFLLSLHTPTMIIKRTDTNAFHPQTFYTQFRIKYAVLRACHSPGSLLQRENTCEVRLRILAGIAMAAFKDDVCALIGAELEAAEANIVNDDDDENTTWTKIRLTAYRQWLKLPYPLGWDDGSQESMKLLLRMSSSTIQDRQDRLPQGDPPTLSIDDFVEAFCTVGNASSLRTVRAPFWSKGTAPRVIRTVFTEATRLLGRNRPQEERLKDIKRALVCAANEQRIHVVPMSTGRGRIPTLAAWSTIGASRAEYQPDAHLSYEERQAVAVNRALHKARRLDARGPWTTKEYVIEAFGECIQREVLPKDWNYGPAKVQSGDLVQDTYEWAALKFKGHFTSWKVRLAHILGFLISKITPAVSWPSLKGNAMHTVNKQLSEIFRDCDWYKSIDIIRQMEWIEKTTSKGRKDASLFYTQASIVFLAYMDATSPLRIALDQKRTSLSKSTWLDRHSKSPFLAARAFGCIHICPFNVAHRDCLTAMKGLNTLNLLRMGVCEGKGEALTNGPHYRRDYRVRSDEDLKKWHDWLCAELVKKPNGPYNVCIKIFGTQGTQILVDKGQFPSLRKQGGLKRSRVQADTGDRNRVVSRSRLE